MQEIKQFIQETVSQQAIEVAELQANLEEARTWATTARVSATKLKNNLKYARNEMGDLKD